MNYLSNDLNLYIGTFLCKYCNELKYINKEYYRLFRNPYEKEFLKIKDNYNIIFHNILNTSFYKKCFNCYYLSFESIKFLCNSYNIIYKFNSKKEKLKKDESTIVNLNIHLHNLYNFDDLDMKRFIEKEKLIMNNIYKILFVSKNVLHIQYCCEKRGIMYKLEICNS